MQVLYEALDNTSDEAWATEENGRTRMIFAPIQKDPRKPADPDLAQNALQAGRVLQPPRQRNSIAALRHRGRELFLPHKTNEVYYEEVREEKHSPKSGEKN